MKDNQIRVNTQELKMMQQDSKDHSNTDPLITKVRNFPYQKLDSVFHFLLCLHCMSSLVAIVKKCMPYIDVRWKGGHVFLLCCRKIIMIV